MSVKVIHIHEANDIQDEGYDLPGIERGEQQKEKEGKTRKSESRSVPKRAEENNVIQYRATQRWTTTSDSLVIPSGRMRE
jgi:hypothetical protein